MAFNYGKLSAKASGLISKFGKSVTVSVIGAESYDPITDTVTSTATATVITAVVLPFNNQAEQLLPDTVIYSQSNKLLVDGALIIKLLDVIVIDGANFVVQYAKALNPNIGSPIMQTVVVVR